MGGVFRAWPKVLAAEGSDWFGRSMGRFVNSTYVTLDGVISDPQDWPSLGSFSGRGNEIQTELLLACDVLVMGRRTYDGFAPVWPTMSGDPYSDRINAMPKYVASTTLTDPTWANTTVIAGDLARQVAELKSRTSGNVIQYGFGAVSQALMQAGLIDELRLCCTRSSWDGARPTV